MAYPSIYDVTYSYIGFQQSQQGISAFPGTQLDADLIGLHDSLSSLSAFMRDVFRSDGGLVAMPGSVAKATEAEALAGTDNVDYMTPYLTAQAIGARVPAKASEAEALAGTNDVKFMTPYLTTNKIDARLPVDVTRFGAKADSTNGTDGTLNTAAIQDAIDFVHAASLSRLYSGAGSGLVVIPAGAGGYRTGTLTMRKGVSMDGQGSLSSSLYFNDCDGITFDYLSNFSQPTISRIGLIGINATAARTAIKRAPPVPADENNVLTGLDLHHLMIQAFDTAIFSNGGVDWSIKNIKAEDVNNGIVGDGVFYNVHIDGVNMRYGVGAPGGVRGTGLALRNYNYTAGVGILPPEGVRLGNCQLFQFATGIDVEGCDTLWLENGINVVATVRGIRASKVTSLFSLKGFNVEMQGAAAVVAIELPGLASATTLDTIISGGIVRGAGTTNCDGIIVNGAATSLQDNVTIENVLSIGMTKRDFDIFNPGGNFNLSRLMGQSTGTTESIRIGTFQSGIVSLDKVHTVKGWTYTTPADVTNGFIREKDCIDTGGNRRPATWTVDGARGGALLDTVSGFSSTGALVRTAAGTYAFRTLTAPAAGVTVTNGNGVSGNPTLALTNDLAALEALTGTGIPKRSGVDAWVMSPAINLLSEVANVLPVANGGNGNDSSWTTPSFSAANFTANAAGTWTVAAGDVTTFMYNVRGKVMTLIFTLATTTVGGVPDAELRIAIPGGFLAAARVTQACGLITDNGTRITAYADSVGAGNAYIAVIKHSGAIWTASVDNTAVYGSITFPIQ